MPVNLLPHLRHLNPSIPFAGISLMKPSPSIRASRVVPVLSKVFPHKIKVQSFSQKIGFSNVLSHQELSLVGLGGRKLSTVSEIRASRSLIDDEAELSDWVSDLSTKNSRSFGDGDRNRSEGFSRGGGRGRGRGGRGGRGEGRFSSVKRSRDSDSDGYSGGNRGEDSWSSYNSSNSRGRGGRGGGRRFGGENDRRDDRFSSRRENGYEGGSSRGRGNAGSFDSFPRNSSGRGRFGSEGGRGNAGSFDSFPRSSSGRGRFENEGGRGSDSDDYGVPSRGRGGRGGRGRGNRGSLDSFTGSSRGTARFGGRSERDDDGYLSRGRDDSSRGTARFGGRSERDDDGYVSRGRDDNFRGGARGGGRGGGEMRRGGKTFGRASFSMSDKDTEDDLDDEEGEEKLMSSTFGELISEDDEDVDDDRADEDDSDDADDYEMLKKSESLSGIDIDDSLPATPRSPPGASDSHLSETRFDQCEISALSLKAIKDAGYEKMTIVQEATLPLILKGKDVLAKAKTGTGKTVAFLLPSIETISKLSSAGHDQRRPPIFVLVICPTRELASQAATEANTLAKYHRSIGVQVVIGGTRLTLEQKRLQANPCQILVATPGRLKDHIENTAGFATRLMGVKVLVLDEADHLLDMGFRRDIERIIAAVPKDRQTLLFSATVPPEVRQICHIALKKDHEFINTVKDTEETHAQVRQTYLVAPLDKQFSILYALLKDHIADDPDYKVLVFCTTAMVTKLVADFLGVLKMNVREIHSRKAQNYRTRVSDEFRKSTGIILVTSDVSARGVDYPDVTFVIQVGLPSDKQQYIHRLGRTGRKGKEGQGLILLAPWEEFFLSTLKDLPLSKAESPLVDPDTKKLVDRALSHVEMKNKESAYQAWLGYYNSNKTVGRDKTRLVELANEFSRSMGLSNPPAISKQTLGKMGLRNVPGLRSK